MALHQEQILYKYDLPMVGDSVDMFGTRCRSRQENCGQIGPNSKMGSSASNQGLPAID